MMLNEVDSSFKFRTARNTFNEPAAGKDDGQPEGKEKSVVI